MKKATTIIQSKVKHVLETDERKLNIEVINAELLDLIRIIRNNQVIGEERLLREQALLRLKYIFKKSIQFLALKYHHLEEDNIEIWIDSIIAEMYIFITRKDIDLNEYNYWKIFNHLRDVAKNRYNKQKKEYERAIVLDNAYVNAIKDETLSTEDRVISNMMYQERKKILHKIVKTKLNVQDSELIKLLLTEKFNIKEYAVNHKISLQAAYKRLNSVRNKMRKFMQEAM